MMARPKKKVEVKDPVGEYVEYLVTPKTPEPELYKSEKHPHWKPKPPESEPFRNISGVPAPAFEGSAPSGQLSPFWRRYGSEASTGGVENAVDRIVARMPVPAPLDGDGNVIPDRSSARGPKVSDYRPFYAKLLREADPFAEPQTQVFYDKLRLKAQQMADDDYFGRWEGRPYGIASIDRDHWTKCSAETWHERLNKYMPCPEKGMLTQESTGKPVCKAHATASEKLSAGLFRLIPEAD
jgi:hypothetical protein